MAGREGWGRKDPRKKKTKKPQVFLPLEASHPI